MTARPSWRWTSSQVGRSPLPNTGETVSFGERESKELYKCLIKGDFLDGNDRPSIKFKEGGFYEYAVVHLPEDMREEPLLQAAELLVRSVYDPSVLSAMITDGNTPKVTSNALNDNYRKQEFKELWRRINKKHAYTVSFDDEELICKSVGAIDSKLPGERARLHAYDRQSEVRGDA